MDLLAIGFYAAVVTYGLIIVWTVLIRLRWLPEALKRPVHRVLDRAVQLPVIGPVIGLCRQHSLTLGLGVALLVGFALSYLLEVLGPTIVQLLIVAVTLPLFLLPTLIAVKKQHRHRTAIGLVNVFGSFFFGLGWFIALVWNFVEPRRTGNRGGRTGKTAHLEGTGCIDAGSV